MNINQKIKLNKILAKSSKNKFKIAQAVGGQSRRNSYREPFQTYYEKSDDTYQKRIQKEAKERLNNGEAWKISIPGLHFESLSDEDKIKVIDYYVNQFDKGRREDSLNKILAAPGDFKLKADVQEKSRLVDKVNFVKNALIGLKQEISSQGVMGTSNQSGAAPAPSAPAPSAPAPSASSAPAAAAPASSAPAAAAPSASSAPASSAPASSAPASAAPAAAAAAIPAVDSNVEKYHFESGKPSEYGAYGPIIHEGKQVYFQVRFNDKVGSYEATGKSWTR